MRVQGLAEEGHVVLPADGGGEVDAHAADGGGHGAEGAGGALGPAETLGAGLGMLVCGGEDGWITGDLRASLYGVCQSCPPWGRCRRTSSRDFHQLSQYTRRQ